MNWKLVRIPEGNVKRITCRGTVIWERGEYVLKLRTPVCNIVNDLLTVTVDERATAVKVSIVGSTTKEVTIQNSGSSYVTLDLSTQSLAGGNYQIKAYCQASGLENSAYSETVTWYMPRTYTVAKTGVGCTVTAPATVMEGEDVIASIAITTGYERPVVTGTGFTSYSLVGSVLTLTGITGNVTLTVTCSKIVYNIYNLVQYGVLSGDSTIEYGGTATVYIQPNSGKGYPLSIEVTGATGVYTYATGKVELSNCTGNVTIIGECGAVVYSITKVGTHCDIEGSDTIAVGQTVTLQVTADTGYLLPDNISVSGCDFVYDRIAGTILLSNATGNVSVSVSGNVRYYSVVDNVSYGYIVGTPVFPLGGGGTITISPNTGYTLPSTVSVSGATLASYDSSTGEISVTSVTGTVYVTGICSPVSYTIDVSHCTNCSVDGQLTIHSGETVQLEIEPNTGYEMPNTVNVTGANYTYEKTTSKGYLTLSNATANVTVYVDAIPIVYAISGNVTHGSYSGDTQLVVGTPAVVVITPATGYALPDSVSVSGASYTWNKTTGQLALSNGTNPNRIVTFTVACVPVATYEIDVQITNGTSGGDTEIVYLNSATVRIYPTSGYAYPASVSVTNATVQSYNNTTGVLVLSNPTGRVLVQATCPSASSYSITYNLNGCIDDGINPSTIAQNGSATCKFEPISGYKFEYQGASATIVVSGATSSVNMTATKCEIVLSNPTGNVTVSIDAVPVV